MCARVAIFIPGLEETSGIFQVIIVIILNSNTCVINENESQVIMCLITMTVSLYHWLAIIMVDKLSLY